VRGPNSAGTGCDAVSAASAPGVAVCAASALGVAVCAASGAVCASNVPRKSSRANAIATHSAARAAPENSQCRSLLHPEQQQCAPGERRHERTRAQPIAPRHERLRGCGARRRGGGRLGHSGVT